MLPLAMFCIPCLGLDTEPPAADEFEDLSVVRGWGMKLRSVPSVGTTLDMSGQVVTPGM